jgi:uncharacterized protein YciI
MRSFYCRLVAPRATFGQDMSPAEGALMQQHAAHWMQSDAWQHVLAFGVVADPAGVFGVAIIEAEDESAVRAVTDADPVIRANAGFRYEILAMPMGARPQRGGADGH